MSNHERPRQPMHIRAARPDDAESLAALATQLGYSSDRGMILARLNSLAALPDHAVFVAEAESRVIGWIALSIHQSLESGAWAEMERQSKSPEMSRAISVSPPAATR